MKALKKQMAVSVFLKWLTGIALVLMSMTGWANRDITLISGFDYASGDYDQPAEFVIRSSPLVVKLDSKEWVAKMQSSYLQINTRSIDGRNTRQQGGGDTILSIAKKSWFRLKGIQYLNAGVNVKLPTASKEKQLGTGETDWMVQLDTFRHVGKWLPFGKLGYRWFGDSLESPREDGVFGSVGLHYQLNARISVGGLLDYRSASTIRVKEGKEFIPYVQYRLNNRWTIGLYGVAGLSPASPDRGGGIQLVYRSAAKGS